MTKPPITKRKPCSLKQYSLTGWDSSKHLYQLDDNITMSGMIARLSPTKVIINYNTYYNNDETNSKYGKNNCLGSTPSQTVVKS